MTRQQPTRKEHYIPQVYLKGFSSQNDRLYFYDLSNHRYSNQMVSAKTLCYKKDLYEYRDKTNNIIHTNTIERALSILERMYAQNRNAINSRIRIANPKTNSFMSNDDSLFWITYTTIQMLRMPKIINEVTQAICELIPSNEDSNLQRNTALFLLLPFLRKLEPNSVEGKLFSEIFNSICKMRCTIAYDDKKRLFTSDSPMYMYAPTQKIQDCQKILFPINSSLCLIYSEDEFYPDNGIISIDDIEFEVICKSIAYAADQFLYTSRKFAKQELSWIKQARKNKEMDTDTKY